jgi:hypothetical protein
MVTITVSLIPIPRRFQRWICGGTERAIVDNAWNRDRQESEVSLAKGKATLEQLVEWFFN